MKENSVILSVDDIVIYNSEIEMIVDDYISSLPDENLIYKSSPFKGLLLNIYNQKIKYIIDMDKQNRHNKFNNYRLLDGIFNNIYIPLVYRFNLIPTILEFCVFVNIDNANLTDIRNGVFRSNGSKVNPENTQTVKKWFEVCESALASRAFLENSIGCIFGLKAAHGWQEAKQQIEIVNNSATQATPQQIAAKYADIAKPMLSDSND